MGDMMEGSERRLYRSCAADFQALVHVAAPGTGGLRTAGDVCVLLERQYGLRIQRYAASLGGHPYGLVLRGTTDVLDVTDLGLDRFDAQGRSRLATDPVTLPYPVGTD